MAIDNVYTVSFSGSDLTLEDKIERAFSVGITSFRINLKTFSRVERVAKLAEIITGSRGNKVTTMLIDLPYPYEKTRTTKVSGDYSIDVVDGEEIYIIGENSNFNPHGQKAVWIDEQFFEGKTEIGAKCKYGDGEGVLQILEKLEENVLRTKVIGSFALLRSKPITLSKEKKSNPESQTVEELKKLFKANEFAKICLSFVREKDDIVEACNLFEIEPNRIIAKIENKYGVENIESILDACGGIMIARGDLGLDIPITDLYETQNYLAAKAKEKKKMLYIATDIMQSLCSRIIPCRADIIDLSVICSYRPNGIVYKAHALNSNRIHEINKTLCSFTERWDDHQ